MKRERDEEERETDKDKSQQSLFYVKEPNALFLIFLRNLDIKHIFRFRAIALLRLLQSSTEINQIIEKKVEEEHDFWYYVCKFSFPDIILYIDCHFNQRMIIGDIENRYNVSNEGYERLLFLDFMPKNQYDDIVDFISLNNIRGFCFGNINTTFIDRTLLNNCLLDNNLANETESCFKMLYPCGIPPSEYCSCAQVVLRSLTIEFLLLVSKTMKSLLNNNIFINEQNYDDINMNLGGFYTDLNDSLYIYYTLISSTKVSNLNNINESIRFITLQTCKSLLNKTETRFSIPAITKSSFRNKLEDIFTLRHLFVEIQLFLEKFKYSITNVLGDESIKELTTLLYRVLYTYIEFSSGEEYNDYYNRILLINPLLNTNQSIDNKKDIILRELGIGYNDNNIEEEKNARKYYFRKSSIKLHKYDNSDIILDNDYLSNIEMNRLSRFEKFQTYNPLYIRMYWYDYISLFNTFESYQQWENILKKQVDIIKRSKNEREILELSSTKNDLSCYLCKITDIDQLLIDKDNLSIICCHCK